MLDDSELLAHHSVCVGRFNVIPCDFHHFIHAGQRVPYRLLDADSKAVLQHSSILTEFSSTFQQRPRIGSNAAGSVRALNLAESSGGAGEVISLQTQSKRGHTAKLHTMTELRFQSVNSSMPSVSYIPVMSPTSRKVSSRSPSGFGIPHFSLLPSPRVPSSGGSLSTMSSVSNQNSKRSVSPTPAPSNGNSGTSIPKFRSLRNMLPFGPKQSSTSTAPPPSSNKYGSPPVSFAFNTPGELRHRRSSSSIPGPTTHSANTARNGYSTLGPRTSLSLSVDKTLPPPPSIGRSRSEDLGSSPIISIAPPSASTNELNIFSNSNQHNVHFSSGLPLPDDPFKKPSPTVVLVTNTLQDSSQDLDQIRSAGDLSTIIESELSSMSMSKHLPPLDTSEEGLNPHAEASETDDTDGDGGPLMLAQLAKQVHKNTASTLRAQDMSITSSPVGEADDKTVSGNLSESWEAGLAEFRRTMGHGTTTSSSSSISPIPFLSPSQELLVPALARPKTQLNGKGEDVASDLEHEYEQVSFDLSSLDPDLAALLSPNNLPSQRVEDANAAIAAAVDSVTPPSPMHSSASLSSSPEPAGTGARVSFDRNADTDDIWLSAANHTRSSGESRRRALGLQSSPVRKSRPSSLALSTSSHSTADPVRRTSIETTPMGPSTAGVRRPAVSPTARRDLLFRSPGASTEDLPYDTVRRPMLARSNSALAGPSTLNTTSDGTKRRVPASRLYGTPARPSTATGVPPKGRVVSDSNRPLRVAQGLR
ncbi:hypothetical protein EW145_g6209 [Phellinidium pouzarii]|uniref:Uncharacterized protein n=1 Tax=Phellinidium pouzarii TaxID=167371 RepID=A0A4S4KXA4_9AGAM|nr:hypothetical protein EW145_g6209 [Phellinidium pouzarii]